jgi:hypothetical protein
LNPNLVNRIFQFDYAASNSATLRLSFPDKGSAELFPGSASVLDVFADDSYSLRASTNVTATTAEGQKLNLTHVQQPMFGGDLKEVTDARGNPRLQRASPAVQVEFTGALDSTIQVKTLGSEFALIPDQERQLVFPNGARLILRHAVARQMLDWRIIKGVCQFKVTDFNCWRSTATSGQSGSLQWNPVRKIIDFRNSGEPGSPPIYAQLSGRIHASVGPGATFQYAQFQDCGSFTSSATGGEVYLVDRDTSEITPVSALITYSEGERVGGEKISLPWQPVSFGWQSESRVELRGTSGIIPLDRGNEETMRLGTGELQVSFSTDGNLTFRAIIGNFELNPAFIPELTLNLPEGAAVLANLDHRRHIFSAQAAPESAASTRVVAAGQTYMFLSGTAKISVMVGQHTFIPETATAWIFFEGAGGESVFTSGLQPAPLIRPDRFDASRIVQQPVSVIE